MEYARGPEVSRRQLLQQRLRFLQIARFPNASLAGEQYHLAGTYPICWLGYSQRTDLNRGGGERTLLRGGISR
jgi:hypothetical protein